tara:strand:- start:172 stop:750 length:579 start_codon:yes stop_codon:yes gene_type:complete
MEYGDLQFFDIIIFAGIAAFLVFRLRKVLGKRTGFEKNERTSPQPSNKFVEEKIIPDLDENFIELKKAYKALDDFDHQSFIEGAKIAFETIINAFNSGDKKILKKLLNEDTYNAFDSAINKKLNDPESQIFSLNIKKIESVSTIKDKIVIKIKFISEQFKNNDENTKIKKEDVWSFEKLIKSNDPNWLLIST